MDLGYKFLLGKHSRTMFSFCKMRVTKAINVCQAKISAGNHSSARYFGSPRHTSQGYKCLVHYNLVPLLSQCLQDWRTAG